MNGNRIGVCLLVLLVLLLPKQLAFGQIAENQDGGGVTCAFVQANFSDAPNGYVVFYLYQCSDGSTMICTLISSNEGISYGCGAGTSALRHVPGNGRIQCAI